MIIIKSPREINKMEQASKIVAETHAYLQEKIAPGITTEEINKLGEQYIKQQGARPSFKGYRGYPASVCISINQEVVHGIPSAERRLKNGDIVSLDIGAFYKGFHGDAARTIPVGEVGPEATLLIETTEEAFKEGLNQARTGNRLTDISHAIQTCARSNGFSVVREYVGHGIGSKMHEDPQIPNFGPPGRGPVLKKGMTLAIEPMLNVGTYKVKTLEDRWTVVTGDGSLSAHYENTIALTSGKPLVLSEI